MKNIKSFIEFVNENKIIGGRGDNINELDVDQEEFEVGKTVELEHTDDINISKEIALDHLAEDPKYYSKLFKAGLIDEKTCT